MMEIVEDKEKLDAEFVIKALLQHNYLPTQKEDQNELPPIITSKHFTPDLAIKLINGKCRKSDGYDTVDYKLTRFTGISRICSIPYPTAYADLSICIKENWDSLKYIVENKNSIIRPRRHDDGRIIIMDYESSRQKTRKELESMFSCRYFVRTDISNCYPNIYSHAVPWGIVGIDFAKKQKGDRSLWFNQLDHKISWLKRNETQGVAIGPATSNILCEAILARVDEILSKNYHFVRFIDDYRGYFDLDSEAQAFLRDLENELSKYKLLLNIQKTENSRVTSTFTS